MIEPNNPLINVSDLMQKIENEVRRRHSPGRPGQIGHDVPPEILATAASIEALIRTAEQKAQIRTSWSGRLNRFPFTLSTRLQQFCLRILAFLFKDQRHINFSLIEVLRESSAQAIQLSEQVDQLRTRLNRIEDRVSSIEADKP